MKKNLKQQSMTCLVLLAALLLAVPFSVRGQYKFTYDSQLGAGSKNLLQLSAVEGVEVDAAGNLYVADTHNFSIRKFDSEGNQLLRFGRKGYFNGGFHTIAAVRVDAQGNIYALDRSRGDIQKFDPQGNFLLSFGGPGTGDGKLNFPNDFALDQEGNIFVADTRNKRVQKFDKLGNYLLQFGNEMYYASEMQAPQGIAVTKDGNVHVVETNKDYVQQYDNQGKRLNTSIRVGSRNLRSIDFDEEGNVYVVGFGEVTKLTKEGGYVYTWGSSHYGPATISSPGGVAVGKNGKVYVADWGRRRIQVYSEKGAFPELIQTIGGAGFAPDEFLSPNAVAVNAADELYVIDVLRKVKHFDSTGKLLREWGSHGKGQGQFETPSDVATDASGNVYVSDEYNHNVQKFSADGQWLAEFKGTADQRIGFPLGIHVDKEGCLFVADMDNVKKFDPNGKFLLVVGYNSFGNDKFTRPNDVIVDAEGFIYVLSFSQIYKHKPDGSFVKRWTLYNAFEQISLAEEKLTIDKEGNLVVSRYIRDEVQLYSTEGRYLGKIGSPGHNNGQLQHPVGVAVTRAGDVYVTEGRNGRVQKFTREPAAKAELTQGSTVFLSEEQTYSFGAVRVLEQGMPVPFTLTNFGLKDLYLTGTPAATITGRDPADFVLDLSKMPAKLAPGAQATFTITFHPAAGGPRFAELLLPTSDEESPLIIKLGGQGIRLETTITDLDDLVLKASAAPFKLAGKTNSTSPVIYSVVAGSGQVELSGENNSHVKIIKGGYVTVKATVEENDLYKAASRLIVLTIERQPQQVSFGPVSEKTFGDAPFLPAATASSGLQVNFAVFSGPAAMVEGAGGEVLLDITGAGTVVVLAFQAGDGIYEPASAVMQSFVVRKKQLTVTAEDKSREYQQPDPLFTLAYKGFVKGQNAENLQAQPEVTTEATLQSNVGKYPLTVAGGADNNYELRYVSGTLTITKQKALVSFSDLMHEHTGKPIRATVTTAPEGLQVQVTYNGLLAPPAAAGAYLVEATIREANYEGSARDSLFIHGVHVPIPEPEPGITPTPEPEPELTPAPEPEPEQVELFPNPSDNGKIVLKLEPAFQGALVEVCTLSGGVVMSFKLNDDETQHLDFSALQKGLYLIRFIGPSGVYKTIKFYRL